MKNLPHELFFSTVPCKIGAYPGTFQEFTVKPTTNEDSQKVEEARKRKDPFMSETYKKLIQVPFIPSTDVELVPVEEAGDHPDLITKQPLLQLNDGEIDGMKSGIRSSMVKVGDKFYRLKGCGNNDQEFILRKVQGEDSHEVRGCMFEHTASRALYMSKLISETLKPENVLVNNFPVGIYHYDCSKLLDLKPNEKDDVGKYCAVFETLGDKRLNDHVILGLERILPFFIDIPDKESMMKFFNPDGEKKRFLDFENMEVHATGMLQICGAEAFGGFVDIKKFDDFELKIPSASSPVPKIVNEKYEQLWKNCLLELEKLLLPENKEKMPGKHLFAYIYKRFGFELGKIMRLMHDKDILWGTYQDKLGFHCNAHPNNAVLIFPSPQAYPNREDREGMNLLSCLDFDMAFTKDSFVDGDEKFKEYMNVEPHAMKIALAGGDINTGARELEKNENKALDMYRMGLRDAILLGFQEGYSDFKASKDSSDLFKLFSDDIIYSLFAMALIVTAEIIA